MKNDKLLMIKAKRRVARFFPQIVKRDKELVEKNVDLVNFQQLREIAHEKIESDRSGIFVFPLVLKKLYKNILVTMILIFSYRR